MNQIQFLTLDPAHFHAALVHKEMYAQVASTLHVYGPLGSDLTTHLNRLVGFNSRPDKPTRWQVEAHASPDFIERCFKEKPGNVVVLSGRNRQKIDYIRAALDAGLHVLADKPWIIERANLPKLQEALDLAQAKNLVALDIMTERFEITSTLQRELVNEKSVFGSPVAGSAEEPGVFMESVHYLMKTVAGVPLRRPSWYFDIHQQGEGLGDVGTHEVDLVAWILYPQQSIQYTEQIQIDQARRWPTVLSGGDFERVTGEKSFPVSVAGDVKDGKFHYYCNTMVAYRLRGVHVKLNVRWDYESQTSGGDTHVAVFRGSKSRVEVRQGPEQNYKPELYVVPNQTADLEAVSGALQIKVAALQSKFPGIAVEEKDDELWVTIPDKYRIGHEAHFGEVTRLFLNYLANPQTQPAWEKPNMLAKYYVTTEGVERSRQMTK